MFHRNSIFVTKRLLSHIGPFQRDSLLHKICLSGSVCRPYSQENIGAKSAEGKTGEGPNIIGRLFPQSSTIAADEALQIKKEQEKFEEENKKKQEENEKSWKRMKLGFLLFGAGVCVCGCALVYEMGAPRLDSEGQPLQDEFTPLPLVLQYLRRTWKELTFYEKMIKEPSRDKLLPDPLPAPYQPRYTLLLELTDVLVHPDWSYQTGWRFKKRPGVEAFLRAVSSSDYEVVIFTRENALMLWPVVDKLDPEGKYVAYRLFRDSTHFEGGVHVKNLDALNRDLSKVIAVECCSESVKWHRDNALVVRRWRGADDDTALLDLASLLQAIALSDVPDVREVLRYYAQFEDPLAAYRDNQRRLLDHMQQQQQQQQQQQSASSLTARPASSWLKPFTAR